MSKLDTIISRIREAFSNGKELTTFTGNMIGRTVDFRKIVSVLRKEGMQIEDRWQTTQDGRRYKIYFLSKGIV